MMGGDGETKVAALFPPGSMMNMVKMVTLYRRGSFEIKAQHSEDGVALGKQELGTYRIEVPAQAENKKIKVKCKMTLNGMFTIESAQMVEVEGYDEEFVKEKREVPSDATAAEGEKAEGDVPATDGGSPPEDAKKEVEKKYEWVDVVKKTTKLTRTDLRIHVTGRPGLSPDVLQSKMDEETKMQSDMRDIIETDEKRNDLESYIFNTRDKIAESGEYGPFISEKDRTSFNADLKKAEDWLMDGDGMYATKLQYIEKLDELRKPGDAVVWRVKESTTREEWIRAVNGTILNYRNAVENPGDKYGHIAVDKRSKISAACSDLEKWLAKTKEKQEKLPKYEKPVLLCVDMEKKNEELSKMANDILKEPKPPPPKPPPAPKEEKKEKTEKVEKTDEAPKAEAKEAAASPEAAPQSEKREGPENMDVD